MIATAREVETLKDLTAGLKLSLDVTKEESISWKLDNASFDKYSIVGL